MSWFDKDKEEDPYASLGYRYELSATSLDRRFARYTLQKIDFNTGKVTTLLHDQKWEDIKELFLYLKNYATRNWGSRIAMIPRKIVSKDIPWSISPSNSSLGSSARGYYTQRKGPAIKVEATPCQEQNDSAQGSPQETNPSSTS